MKNHSFYSWRTTVNGNKFDFKVAKNTTRATENENGQFCDTEIIATGTKPTRAQAAAEAKKIMKKLKTFHEIAD